MIGEIRDLETARIAIQAALTGHLVFSTLHTNSAAAAITRLLDMGLENYLLASTIHGIVAQRLVRKLCVSCARPHPAALDWSRRWEETLSTREAHVAPSFLAPAGCKACSGTGFAGRIVVAELMNLSAEIKTMFVKGGGEAEIQEAARRAGMETMFEDGLRKAGQGLTSIEEVLQATRMS
jgi:general secretion pathway protein E